MNFLKKYKVEIIVLIVLIAAIVWIKAKQDPQKRLKKVIQGKAQPKTVEEQWHSANAVEFRKDVWFEDKTWKAQVKNIIGSDTALLSDGRVVQWINPTGRWMEVKQLQTEEGYNQHLRSIGF